MAKTPGSLWVSGSYLHYVGSTGIEYRGLGGSLGLVSGAVKGSLWVDGDYLHYIDESGYNRRLPRVLGSVVTGLPGSIWIEGNYPQFLGSTSRNNQVHANYSDSNAHYDYHGDGYGDAGGTPYNFHIDGWSGGVWSNYSATGYYDTYSNSPAWDDHNNTPTPV